jgi:hypothetical protein
MRRINTQRIPQCGKMHSKPGDDDKVNNSRGTNGVPTLSPASGKSGECEAELIFHK